MASSNAAGESSQAIGWRVPNALALAALAPVLIVGISFQLVPWAFAIPAFAAVGVLVLAWPALAVFGATFAIFTNTSMVAADSLGFHSLTEVILVGLVLVALRDRYCNQDAPAALFPVASIVGLYVVSVAASLLVTVDVDLTVSGIFGTVKGAALACILISVITTGDRFIAAISGLLCGAGFLSLLTLYQAVTGEYGQSFLGYASNLIMYANTALATLRFGGPVGEPNYYAQVLLLAYPITLSMALSSPSRLQAATLFGMAAIVAAATVLTQSRGGLIVLVVLSIATLRPSWRAVAVVLCILPIVALLVSAALPKEFEQRVIAAFGDIQAIVTEKGYILDEAIAGRVSEMLAAWHLFLERPLFGSGYDTYQSLYQDTARRYGLMARGADREAHSLFLEILAERGISGLLAFSSLVTFAISFAVSGARRLSKLGGPLESAASRGVALSILGFLMTSIFLHEAFQWYFWLIFALASAAAWIRPRLDLSASKG